MAMFMQAEVNIVKAIYQNINLTDFGRAWVTKCIQFLLSRGAKCEVIICNNV